MNKILHTPVLINQVIEFLAPGEDKVMIDCTLGAGGHSEAILKAMGGKGALYGLDADLRNLEIAQERLKEFKNAHTIHTNFENLEQVGGDILAREGRIDGILFDLGLSSLHVDEAERGFSFMKDGPLDMRFDSSQGETAADIVNFYPFDSLVSIFKTYGEDKFSHRIATEIIRRRRDKQFKTTTELADFIVELAFGPNRSGKPRFFKIHPATRIFQAIRIATNREIEVLHAGLLAAVKLLSPHGRLVVISYHSLEDRLVKHFFRAQDKDGVVKILTKRPIIPDDQEIKENKRSRSAKLRVAEK